VGNLGHYFPQSQQEAYIQEHLRPGKVLYLHLDFINNPKDKYVILVSTASSFLVMIVNSR